MATACVDAVLYDATNVAMNKFNPGIRLANVKNMKIGQIIGWEREGSIRHLFSG
jgi:hypothetical protein